MNVLIVDDHPMMLEYLSSAVAKALQDTVVRTAGDLKTALERAREIEPKLVLVDLGLPGCGGIDSVLQFRAAFPQVPTVVVSAKDDSLSVRGALAVGAAGFIPKSSSPTVVVTFRSPFGRSRLSVSLARADSSFMKTSCAVR